MWARVVSSPHHHLRHPCACLACATTAAASLAPPVSLAPSLSFVPLASPAWRSRCMCRLRRSWPESLSPLALPVLLAPLAPLEPRAQLACRGSVVRFRTSHTPIVPLARASACACACVLACASMLARGCVCRARACVRACARAWGVCVPAALVPSTKLPAQAGRFGHGGPGPWPRCGRFRCQR